ncbi:MAG: T9SS type A sorting domain-containing protein [Bacteroidota bacterium]|nr:T9SS type A sorting domain-containing protein [Bacteroidota bacterium]
MKNELALIGIPKCRCGFEPRRHYQNAYLQEIDGGNTPLLLQEIQETWPQEAWDLRNELMEISPFVSQEALLEAAESGVLPDAMLFEICMANPDATQNEEFLRILSEDIPNTLPNYMIEMIRDSWDNETTRTVIENGLAQAGWKRDFNLSALLFNEKTQDERFVDSIRYYHNQRDNLSDRYLVADSYIEEDDFTTARSIITSIPLDFDLDDRKTDENDNFLSLCDFLSNLNDSNLTIFDLDSIKIAEMEIIAEETGWAAAKAHNILCYAYDLCVDCPITTDTTGQPKTTYVGKHNMQDVLNQAYNTLTVKPNPAGNHASFEWELPLLENEAYLRLIDLNGSVIQEHTINAKRGQWLWDTREIINGTYLYELVSGDNKLDVGKLIIQK